MSSLRAKRRRSCQGKVPHASREAAQFTIRDMARSHALYRPGLQAYHCRFCGSWHVGHFSRRG